MSTTEAAFLGGFVGVVCVCTIVFCIMIVVAFWKIFKKAGLPGWKAIVPFYNEFLIFKMSWKTKYFWVALVLALVGSILMAADPGSVTTYSTSYANVAITDHSWVYAIGEVLVLACVVIYCICWYYLGKSFGHSVPFFILSIFFPYITTLYLGFNSDKYLGNTTEQNEMPLS